MTLGTTYSISPGPHGYVVYETQSTGRVVLVEKDLTLREACELCHMANTFEPMPVYRDDAETCYLHFKNHQAIKLEVTAIRRHNSPSFAKGGA